MPGQLKRAAVFVVSPRITNCCNELSFASDSHVNDGAVIKRRVFQNLVSIFFLRRPVFSNVLR